jgi:predicted O-methyltransferase YrrM
MDPFSSDFIGEDNSQFIEFLKHQANIEWGGYRLYDGSNNHLQQNPNEFTDFISALKKYEKENKFRFKKFLEIGFHAGFTNTILKKIFNFQEIVAIDIIEGPVSSSAFRANLRFKNLTLICNDSTSQYSINNARKLGPFDLIFIDGNHDYEIAKKDFENYKEMISDNGVIILHDIKSKVHEGIPRLWNEITSKNEYEIDTVYNDDVIMKTGFGILKPKK